MSQETTPQHIQSIRRAVAILRSFTEAEPELGVVELGRRLDLHKSTVSRILNTLQVDGLVSQNPETGKYRLGLGLVSLAGVALGRLDVRGMAQPYLKQLVELSQETVNVTVLDGDECVIVEREASPKSIRYVGWIGRRMPLHCTASGKALLAYTPPAHWEALLPADLPRYTEKTIVDREALLVALTAVRQQGYALAAEEFEEGFCALAAPVFDHAGRTVAAISISGPAYRLETQLVDFIPALQETTAEVSASLGYRGSKKL